MSEFFGDVTHKIVDGVAGLAPPGTPLAVVAGVSDAGTIGASVLIGKEGDVSVFGVGPLVERLRDIQSEADARLNVVAVRVTKISEGTIGAITKTGTGTGTQATAGTPKRAVHVIVIATLDGGNGVAQVKYSLDGGAKYSDPATIPANGQVTLGDTGTRLDFTNAGVPADSVDIGDQWVFHVTEPKSSFAQVLTDIAAAMMAYSPQIVYVVGASDSVDWAAAASEASDLWDAGSPTWFLMESDLPDLLTSETLDAWVTSLVGAVFGDLWVSVSAALGMVYSAVTGETQRRNLAGINLGRLAGIGTQASISRVSDGPLPNVTLVSGYTNTHARNLDNAGYTAVRFYNGLSGVYFANGRMKAAAVSDYRFQEIARVAHKAARETRVEGLQGLGRDVDAAGIADMKARMERPLDRMMAMKPPEILGYELTIPPGQDIVNNGLVYQLRLDGVPIVRSITIYQSFRFGEVV